MPSPHNSLGRFLIASTAVMAMWVTAITIAMVLFVNGVNERYQDQRNSDCIASLDIRENNRQLTIDQWRKVVDLTGGDAETEKTLADLTTFISDQYEALPPPPPCPGD